MKKLLATFIFTILMIRVIAQVEPKDSVFTGQVTVIKDERLDILAKKQLDFNTMSNKVGKGYRLLVLSSNDRDKVMTVRTKLLQQFPDQKVYMVFQAPFIKLKFGDFDDKAEAEKYRDLLSRMRLVTTNVYIVPEVVELKVKHKE